MIISKNEKICEYRKCKLPVPVESLKNRSFIFIHIQKKAGYEMMTGFVMLIIGLFLGAVGMAMIAAGSCADTKQLCGYQSNLLARILIWFDDGQRVDFPSEEIKELLDDEK